MRTVQIIGEVHFRIGLEPQWYMGGYCFILNQLAELVLATYPKKPERAAAVIAAINRAVFLDMNMALSVFKDVETRATLKQACRCV